MLRLERQGRVQPPACSGGCFYKESEGQEMTDYEIFRELATRQILDYMPEEFNDYKVEVKKVSKTNQMLDGLHLQSPENRGIEISPTIYIDHMYEDYRNGKSFAAVMKEAADGIQKAYEQIARSGIGFNIADAKERVVMDLINTEQNRTMLEKLPHREFCDLSIVYRVVTKLDGDSLHSALVNHDLAKEIGMEEQQLYETALVNTKKLFPPLVQSMREVIRELSLQDGMSEEIADIVAAGPVKNEMYVLSNKSKVNGAVAMLYEGELQKIAEASGTDLYVLPSSRHEVIAVPVAEQTLERLVEMVEEVNMTQVALEDRLSNQVYHYDKDLRELTLATDTPNKRLDSIVMEIPAHGPERSR